MSRTRHATVPIFIPHSGCPQQCVFCDQKFISGTRTAPTAKQVQNALDYALKNISERAKPAQIAFFGGSFTAVERTYMVELLIAAQQYINDTDFYGIRISTRPDAIDEEVLEILRNHNVTDVEIGVQSMDDGVLRANRRGHSVEDTVRSAELVKNFGFGLVLQMMTGLVCDNTENTINTAKRIIQLEPDSVRIYPAVVLKNTRLSQLYSIGEYSPQSLAEAVSLSSVLLEMFYSAGIPVVKLGLHDSPSLKDAIVAGPFHPAFRELCEGEVLLRKVLDASEKKALIKGKIGIEVEPRSVSKMTGHRRGNMEKLARLGYDARIIPNEEIPYLEVRVTGEVN